jgi:hypothetical protein
MISIGIDTGAQGAIASIDPDCRVFWSADLPCRKRGLDVPRFRELLVGQFDTHWHNLPLVIVEWNVGRASNPATGFIGDAPDTSFQHGLNSGGVLATLEMLDWSWGENLRVVTPAEWTARIGIRGKADDPSCRERAAKLVGVYPELSAPDSRLWGSRGGVRKGPCDAFLLAHYGQLVLRAGCTPRGVSPIGVTVGKWCRRQPKGMDQPDVDTIPDWKPAERRAATEWPE